MKRPSLPLTCLVLLGCLSVVFAGRAYADVSQSLPDDQIARIKQNCVRAQTTMTQLQQSDTVLRVNLGQQYEFISGKLMAPMNSRIVLNQMDIGQLVGTTTTFQQQIDTFRTAYLAYGESLDTVVHEDCKKNPQQFYDEVAAARSNRQAVQAAVADLTATLHSYGAQIDQFAKSVKADTGEQAK